MTDNLKRKDLEFHFYNVSEKIFANIIIIPEDRDNNQWSAVINLIMYSPSGEMLHANLESDILERQFLNENVSFFITNPSLCEDLILKSNAKNTISDSNCCQENGGA